MLLSFIVLNSIGALGAIESPARAILPIQYICKMTDTENEISFVYRADGTEKTVHLKNIEAVVYGTDRGVSLRLSDTSEGNGSYVRSYAGGRAPSLGATLVDVNANLTVDIDCNQAR